MVIIDRRVIEHPLACRGVDSYGTEKIMNVHLPLNLGTEHSSTVVADPEARTRKCLSSHRIIRGASRLAVRHEILILGCAYSCEDAVTHTRSLCTDAKGALFCPVRPGRNLPPYPQYLFANTRCLTPRLYTYLCSRGPPKISTYCHITACFFAIAKDLPYKTTVSPRQLVR